jgi:hypothetical protein
LGAQRCSEDELTDRAREPVRSIQHLLLVTNIGFVPREEGVEGEARDENAVYELEDAGEDEEDEEGVDEFQAGRCGVEVRIPERMQGDRGQRGRGRFGR